MQTMDWKSIKSAKVLVIGHDPRLQKSDTIAEYALFADYFFKDKPSRHSEIQKFNFAKSTFDQILEITNKQILPQEIYLTNLCNVSLPHAPKNKTVLIPESEAIKGVENIRKILQDNPTIEYIFPMSLQVNYWLQKLDFYDSNNGFVEKAAPKAVGLNSDSPYYTSERSGIFLTVCGNQYKIKNGSRIVIPILHSKNYPPKGNLTPYLANYEEIKDYFELKK